MNYPDNVNMDLAIDRPEPVFSHYEVSYNGYKVKCDEFDSLSDAFEFAKVYTKLMAEDTGLDSEKVSIEIAYEGDFENDVFKTVEYDNKIHKWEVK